MNPAERQLKLEIINSITGLKEIRVLKEIKRLLDFELSADVCELSPEQSTRIAQAKQEYANGEIISDEDLNREIEQCLNV